MDYFYGYTFRESSPQKEINAGDFTMRENLSKCWYNKSLSHNNTLPSLFSKKKKNALPKLYCCKSVIWKQNIETKPNLNQISTRSSTCVHLRLSNMFGTHHFQQDIRPLFMSTIISKTLVTFCLQLSVMTTFQILNLTPR